jgi:ABC-2 type transport system permease protein
MSVQTNAVSEQGFGAEAVAAPAVRVTRPVYWSVKREVWENRSIYLVPLAAAALVVLGMLYGAFEGIATMRSHNPDLLQMTIGQQQQCSVTAMFIMVAAFVVAVFYCIDALYGERRDRSVLFWRSLPVSDTVAVLAKTSIPVVILPIVTFVIAAVTQWVVVGIDAMSVLTHGSTVLTMSAPSLLKMQAGLLYHLLAVHGLWYAPIYGWLLLVSAWARRAPILWAVLPVLAVEIVEKIAFNTTHFARFIGERFSGGPARESFAMNGMQMTHTMPGATLGQFLVSPGLWGGLFVAGLFLAGAVWLRRYRTAN